MAQKRATHVCLTCGKTAGSSLHLCNPAPLKKAVTCEYCGALTDDPRHVCAPKVADLKYVCLACGRLAASRSLLCKPSPIPGGDKPNRVKKTAKNKAKGKPKKP